MEHKTCQNERVFILLGGDSKGKLAKISREICGTGFVKLFLYAWQKRHFNEEDPQEVVLIREKKLTIPEFILSKAINRTFELTPQDDISEEPCMCAKL